MAARVARNSSVNCLSAVAWLCSRVRTSCAATFTMAVPPPGIHPEVALAASASRTDELEPTAGRGSDAAFCGSDAAFPARRLGGTWIATSAPAAGSPSTDCAGGGSGWPPWAAPVGGVGSGAFSKMMTSSPLPPAPAGRRWLPLARVPCPQAPWRATG